MSVASPHSGENDLRKIVSVVRALCEGRSNAAGSFTLAPGATTTTVAAPTCGAGSKILFAPETANAAAAAATTYVLAANVTAGQFIVTHANNAQADRTFSYEVRG
jgi:hypothetical protein